MKEIFHKFNICALGSKVSRNAPELTKFPKFPHCTKKNILFFFAKLRKNLFLTKIIFFETNYKLLAYC